MGQLCGKCVQFFCDCSLSVKAMSSDLMQDIRECLAQIHDCPCLKRRNFETRHLYKPDLLREEEIAQEFIQQVQRGETFLHLEIEQLRVQRCLFDLMYFALPKILQFSSCMLYAKLFSPDFMGVVVQCHLMGQQVMRGNF